MNRHDQKHDQSHNKNKVRIVRQGGTASTSAGAEALMEPVDESVLERLSTLIREHIGLDYNGESLSDLERALRRAAGDFGFQGAQGARHCAEWLVSGAFSREQIDTLARYLTIGETYFFRDPALFESLRLHIWPALLQLRRASGSRELRIWSAACCTGEEPYSLAMQLHSLLPNILPDWRAWKISILATDLNPVFLKKAENAIYTSWSFRSASRDEQKTYFDITPEGRFQLKPEIRRYVRFARLNLVSDIYPAIANGTGAMDIIFCRNVLMYFAPPQARAVVSNLIRCLNDGAYLAPAASEASAALFAPLVTVPLPGVILYQKTSAPPNENHAAKHHPAKNRVSLPPPISHKTAYPPKPVKSPEKAKSASLTAEEWHEKAHRAAGLGNLAEALEFCDHAITQDKMKARYYYLRASILMEKKAPNSGGSGEEVNVRDAEAALRRALYLEPDFALAHFVLGNLERRRGRTEQARRAWLNALRVIEDLPADTPLDDGDELTAGHAAAFIERALLSLDEN
jgi:chemotaxis protein methyltransferase CheR